MRWLFASTLVLAACGAAPVVASEQPADAAPPAAAEPDAPEPARPAEDAAPDVAAPRFTEGPNPVLDVNLPDPDVQRVVDASGHVSYRLSGTIDSGDFPAYVSDDLVHWTPQPGGLFGTGQAPGASLALGGAHYCSLWAPAFGTSADGRSFLTFTGTRFAEPQAECPESAEDTGVYVAEAATPGAPFTNPVPLDTDATCTESQPFAPEWAESGCFGGDCDRVARLDGQPFVDPADGRAWLGYAWYTNTPPETAWERDHYGEHVSLVQLDSNDLRRVACEAAEPIHLADPHDPTTLDALAASCDGCDAFLSTTNGRDGAPMIRDDESWGVTEGPSFLRRGPFVYAFVSAGVWDSLDYSVYYAFAETVEGLALDSPTRHVGRLLIPGGGQSFGHGSPVLGPDGEHWFFVHHRLLQAPCLDDDECPRQVWLSPLEFEDHGDGLGAVWPTPVRPAEHLQVRVPLSR